MGSAGCLRAEGTVAMKAYGYVAHWEVSGNNDK